MTNELAVGARRIGSVIDFDEATPELSGMLERSETRIVLSVSWSDVSSPYAAWFGHGPRTPKTVGASDGAVVPRLLLFNDAHGPVLLVGCRNGGYNTQVFGPGFGTIVVDYAVLGVREHVDLEDATGVESEVSGLREWLQIQGVKRVDNDDDSLRRQEIHVEAAKPIAVGGTHNLVFRSAPRVSPPGTGDDWKLHDVVYCVATTTTPTSVHALQAHHRAVRDLLVISRWTPETCTLRRLQHPAVQLRTLDGAEKGAKWCDVVVSTSPEPQRPNRSLNDLVRFDEIGIDGVSKWIKMREEFARALDPVISTRNLDASFPATYLAQVGPGLEALGYLLIYRDTGSKTSAKAASLSERLERILQDVGQCAPINVSTWAASTAKAYNGVKHVNREMPDPVDALNTWRESVLVVRAWVALQLGIDPKQVTERLRRDPQAHAYVPT